MTADAGPVQTNGITKDEVDVYDRQIRLWGLEAQNMLVAFVHLATIRIKAPKFFSINSWSFSIRS